MKVETQMLLACFWTTQDIVYLVDTCSLCQESMRIVFALLREKSTSISGAAKVIGIMSSFMWRRNGATLHSDIIAAASYFWEGQRGNFYTKATDADMLSSLPQKLIVQLFFGFLPFGKWISWEIRVALNTSKFLGGLEKENCDDDITTPFKTCLRNIDAKSRAQQKKKFLVSEF